MRNFSFFIIVWAFSNLAYSQSSNATDSILALQHSKITRLEHEISGLKQQMELMRNPEGIVSYRGPLTLPGRPQDQHIAAYFGFNPVAVDFVKRVRLTADRFCLEKGHSKGSHSFEIQDPQRACGLTYSNNSWTYGCGAWFQEFRLIHCL